MDKNSIFGETQSDDFLFNAPDDDLFGKNDQNEEKDNRTNKITHDKQENKPKNLDTEKSNEAKEKEVQVNDESFSNSIEIGSGSNDINKDELISETENEKDNFDKVFNISDDKIKESIKEDQQELNFNVKKAEENVSSISEDNKKELDNEDLKNRVKSFNRNLQSIADIEIKERVIEQRIADSNKEPKNDSDNLVKDEIKDKNEEVQNKLEEENGINEEVQNETNKQSKIDETKIKNEKTSKEQSEILIDNDKKAVEDELFNEKDNSIDSIKDNQIKSEKNQSSVTNDENDDLISLNRKESIKNVGQKNENKSVKTEDEGEIEEEEAELSAEKKGSEKEENNEDVCYIPQDVNFDVSELEAIDDDFLSEIQAERAEEEQKIKKRLGIEDENKEENLNVDLKPLEDNDTSLDNIMELSPENIEKFLKNKNKGDEKNNESFDTVNASKSVNEKDEEINSDTLSDNILENFELNDELWNNLNLTKKMKEKIKFNVKAEIKNFIDNNFSKINKKD